MANRTFSTMKTNVGLEIQDTSSAMATMIGKFLNRRYFQVLRSINWQQINDDYTVSVTAGTQDYSLAAATDFGKEIACFDTTNDTELSKVDLAALWQEYGGEGLDTAGTVERYSIWINDAGTRYIKFHYKPSQNITVALPYIVKPAEMSADASTTLFEMGDLLEAGARADCWRYKRQFAKASAEEAIFATLLAEYIWEQENQPNQIYQLKPNTFDKDLLY